MRSIFFGSHINRIFIALINRWYEKWSYSTTRTKIHTHLVIWPLATFWNRVTRQTTKDFLVDAQSEILYFFLQLVCEFKNPLKISNIENMLCVLQVFSFSILQEKDQKLKVTCTHDQSNVQVNWQAFNVNSPGDELCLTRGSAYYIFQKNLTPRSPSADDPFLSYFFTLTSSIKKSWCFHLKKICCGEWLQMHCSFLLSFKRRFMYLYQSGEKFSWCGFVWFRSS